MSGGPFSSPLRTHILSDAHFVSFKKSLSAKLAQKMGFATDTKSSCERDVLKLLRQGWGR